MMSNFNNNNKSAWNSSSNPWKNLSNTSKNIYASDWNSLSKKWYSSLNPSKNIDEHGKQSSLEEDSVKIIGTRPPISCHVSTIGQNLLIPNTNRFSEKIPDHDQQNHRQHYSSYYQAQPAVKNDRLCGCTTIIHFQLDERDGRRLGTCLHVSTEPCHILRGVVSESVDGLA